MSSDHGSHDDLNIPYQTPTNVSAQRSTKFIMPLALAQFLASYAASSMNVAISDITRDLQSSVTGVQTVITLFTLTMAVLMLPGSKLTDIWGRKTCFVWGLSIYGCGALIAAFAGQLGILIVGYSLLQGIGSALLIPPIYVLTTIWHTEVTERARAFALISAMAALGAAAGPLIGGFIISALSWRTSFVLQACFVVGIIFASRKIVEPKRTEPKSSFDFLGAILAGFGLALIVLGLLQAGSLGLVLVRHDINIGRFIEIEKGDISPAFYFLILGLALLAWFYFHIRSYERKNKQPLIVSKIFRNRVSNIGLITQNIQWLIMIGGFFIISLYLQLSLQYNAVETGAALTPATIGILLASARAGVMARRYSQRALVRTGFFTTVVGMVLLLFMVDSNSNFTDFILGLFVVGLGIGVMLTASVNIVQSAFPEKEQGEISGLSRSVSNLGSSFGVAIAGGLLIAALTNHISKLTISSKVLSQEQKEKIEVALQKDFNAMSSNQVRQMIQGQDPTVIEEVVKINDLSRNRALGIALAGMTVICLIGFATAMLLPPVADRKTGN